MSKLTVSAMVSLDGSGLSTYPMSPESTRKNRNLARLNNSASDMLRSSVAIDEASILRGLSIKCRLILIFFSASPSAADSHIASALRTVAMAKSYSVSDIQTCP